MRCFRVKATRLWSHRQAMRPPKHTSCKSQNRLDSTCPNHRHLVLWRTTLWRICQRMYQVSVNWRL